MLEKAFLKSVSILKKHEAEVLDRVKRLCKGESLLNKHYARIMIQILALDHFDSSIMRQVLDRITVSESGHIKLIFLKGTVVDMWKTATDRLRFFCIVFMI